MLVTKAFFAVRTLWCGQRRRACGSPGAEGRLVCVRLCGCEFHRDAFCGCPSGSLPNVWILILYLGIPAITKANASLLHDGTASKNKLAKNKVDDKQSQGKLLLQDRNHIYWWQSGGAWNTVIIKLLSWKKKFLCKKAISVHQQKVNIAKITSRSVTFLFSSRASLACVALMAW